MLIPIEVQVAAEVTFFVEAETEEQALEKLDQGDFKNVRVTNWQEEDPAYWNPTNKASADDLPRYLKY